MKKHVIVGNGGAAIAAVQAIRSVTEEDEVVVIAKENCPAYSPVLETYYLAGKIPYNGMFLCDEGFYRENNVKVILGCAVDKVSPVYKAVRLADGTSIRYDKLLVATGSSPVVPAIEGVRIPGVFTLSTAEDTRKIWEASQKSEKVAIIGAGFIGIQVADALARRGKRLTLIEFSNQVMPLVLDAEAATILQEKLAQSGVDVHINMTVSVIKERAGTKVLVLASGAHVEADIVILATGVKPNVGLLEGSGIEVSQGVLVDEYARTNVEDVYAAGDVAEAFNPVTKVRQVNATWFNAVAQGRAAGLNMAGQNAISCKNVRINILSFSGFPFVSMGVARGGEGTYEEISKRDGESYRRFLFKGDALVGAVLAGDVDDAGILVSLIERQVSSLGLKEELLRDRAFGIHAKAFSYSTFGPFQGQPGLGS